MATTVATPTDPPPTSMPAPPTSMPAPPTVPSTTAPNRPADMPGVNWGHTDAVAAGFDPAALDALAEQSQVAGSACTVIVRDGRVVDERYWGDADADTRLPAYSVTKSLTALLVGIAQDDGALATTDRVADYVTEWNGTDSAEVTIEDLLSNDSGRQWDAATDYREMALGAHDKTAFAIALGQDAPPGESWAYNNSAVQVLSRVLETATGQDPATYAAERLFGPIGMTNSAMTHDASGHATTFAGMQTTCLDLARLGVLALNEGAWGDTTVVDQGFVRTATRRPSQSLNTAYGWLWWLNQPGPIASPRIATTGRGAAGTLVGPLAPGLPSDVFWAIGLQSQIVAVIPSEGVVAVRMGAAPPNRTEFDQTVFTQGVFDALADRRGG